MIPVRLELKNFLAYQNPGPLDFADLHLVCLTGENGAGKSSLFDAITWALWGKARANHAELLHGNESEMTVVFSFLLADILYRVTRTFIKTASSTRSDLQFEREDGSGGWRNVAESTVPETEKKIVSELSLDYDTFISSAYLVQGQADRFTSATPARRKEILYQILGLDSWAIYENRVKRLLQGLQTRLAVTEAKKTAGEGALQDRELLDARKAALQIERESLATQLMQLDEKAEVMNARKAEADYLERELDDLLRKVDETKEGIATLTDELSANHEALQNLSALLADSEQIEETYRQYRRLMEQERELSVKKANHLTLEKQSVVLRNAIEIAGRDIQHQININQSRLQGALEKALPLAYEETEDYQSLLVDVTIYENALAASEKLKGDRSECLAERASLENQIATAEARCEELQDQLATLENVSTSICPLCEQPLNDQHKADLIEKLALDLSTLEAECEAQRAKLELSQSAIISMADQIAEAEAKSKSLKSRQDDFIRHQSKRQEALASLPLIAQLEMDVEHDLAILETGEYARPERGELLACQDAIDSLAYSAETHDALKREIIEKAFVEADMQKLKEGEQRFNELTRENERVAGALDSLNNSLALAGEKQNNLQDRLDDLSSMLGGFIALKQEIEQARECYSGVDRELGVLLAEIESNERLIVELKKFESEKAGLADEITLAEELKIAFSKNGVPAMVIEAAIPEIEAEANLILARLAGGSLQIIFETQKEAVAGGIREVLDLFIKDAHGTRKYDLFSGGEAFRVDFAVRLAMAKVMARRSGSQLRTLFIDEGFGTQDEAGRFWIVEILNTIKDDFDLILIITHIDELKEAFPAHIEVMKTDAGSVFSVIG